GGGAAEVARVLRDGGAAFSIPPTAPADFENPYHVHLFEPDTLRAALAEHFGDVEVWGLDGDDAVKADFDRRRRWARRLLAVDVFDVRHRLPREWYVRLHGAARRVAYPVIAAAGRTAPAITADRFALTPVVDASTLVLFAVARRPFGDLVRDKCRKDR